MRYCRSPYLTPFLARLIGIGKEVVVISDRTQGLGGWVVGCLGGWEEGPVLECILACSGSRLRSAMRCDLAETDGNLGTIRK